MVSADDAVAICELLQSASIRVWLTGGWGIDALLGAQTRPHKDLDIIMLVDDVARMRALLDRHGFGLKEIWSENSWIEDRQGGEIATAFVLHDPAGREIDAHAMWLDAEGNGFPAWDAEGFVLSIEDLAGVGMIAGHHLPCLSPESQALCHTGYALPDAQVQDMALLCARFGVAFAGPDS